MFEEVFKNFCQYLADFPRGFNKREPKACLDRRSLGQVFGRSFYVMELSCFPEVESGRVMLSLRSTTHFATSTCPFKYVLSLNLWPDFQPQTPSPPPGSAKHPKQSLQDFGRLWPKLAENGWKWAKTTKNGPRNRLLRVGFDRKGGRVCGWMVKSQPWRLECSNRTSHRNLMHSRLR